MSEEQLNIDAIVKWIELSFDGEVVRDVLPALTVAVENYRFIISAFAFRISRCKSSAGDVSDTLHVRKVMERDDILVINGNDASKVYFAAYHREKAYQETKKKDAVNQINQNLAELLK